jgi:formylglycine-generating enzyme required for sulfatase activity
MSGNAAEWVVAPGERPAQKGGSAVSASAQARCSYTLRSPPTDGNVFVGFRCCADPK